MIKVCPQKKAGEKTKIVAACCDFLVGIGQADFFTLSKIRLLPS